MTQLRIAVATVVIGLAGCRGPASPGGFGVELAQTYPSMSLRTSVERWAPLPMQLVADHTWQIDVESLQAYPFPQLKFDAYGDWSTSFGDSDGDQVCEPGGANIPLYVTGRIRVTFNDATLAYSTQALTFASPWASVQLFGNVGGWMAQTADHLWKAQVTGGADARAADSFRFEPHLADGSPVDRFGLSGTSGRAVAGGAPIPLDLGAFVVTLDDQTMRYTVTPVAPYTSQLGRLFFRGTANGWAATPMTLVGDGRWAIRANFADKPGQRFKLDSAGDWSGALGDSAPQYGSLDHSYVYGRLTATGGDIAISPGGLYYLTVDEAGGPSYMAQRVGGWAHTLDHVSVQATNAVQSKVELALEADHLWSGEITFRHGASRSFTFSTGAQPIAVDYPGTYLVTLDDRTLAHTVGRIADDSLYLSRFGTVLLTHDGLPGVRMIAVGDHLWQGEALVLPGETGQLALTIDTQPYGDSGADGTIDAGGPPISLGAGTWSLLLDDATGKYTLTQEAVGYGRASLQVNRVAFENGQLVTHPLGELMAALGQLDAPAIYFKDVTFENGQLTVDLPPGDQMVTFTEMLSSHWLFTSDPVALSMTSGGRISQSVDVVVESSCFDAFADPGFGRALYVTGQSDYLGSWKSARKMGYGGGHWHLDAHVPPGLAYKVVSAAWVDGDTISTDGVSWERGGNRTVVDPLNYAGGARCDQSHPIF